MANGVVFQDRFYCSNNCPAHFVGAINSDMQANYISGTLLLFTFGMWEAKGSRFYISMGFRRSTTMSMQGRILENIHGFKTISS